MRASRRFLVIALAAGMSLMLASSAGAVVVKLATGQAFGVMPHRGIGGEATPLLASPANSTANSDARVDYQGGIVLHSSSPYLVFWDPASAIPSSSQRVIARYLRNVSEDSGQSTNVYSVLRQFTDTTGFADYQQHFSTQQVFLDQQAYPSAGGCPETAAAYSTCLTDTQVQDELTRIIARRHLPTGTGPGAPMYAVITPENVNICFDTASNICSSNAFCAYHSFYNLSNGAPVVYSLDPFFVFQFGSKGCQTDGTSAYQTPHASGDHGYQIADNLSHELSESITDPTFGGYFNNNTGLEVGDLCATYRPTPDPTNGYSPLAYAPTLGGNEAAGTLFDQLINGNEYYNQTEWSNGDVNCRAQTSPGRPSPVFASLSSHGGGDAGAGPVTFDPTGTSSSAGFSSSTWDFGDGSTPAFNVGAPTSVRHSYRHTGRYRVTLTIVDQVGNEESTTRSILVHGADWGVAPTG